MEHGRANTKQAAQSSDILSFIDRLEDLVGNGTRVPLSNRIMVDEEEFLAAIDQLRVSLPQEIKQARRVVQERAKILSDAQAEAERIVSIAKERAEYLMNEQGLVNESKARSEEILRQAKDSAKRSMGQVDVYALQILTQLEEILEQDLQQIKHAKTAVSSH